MTRQQPFRHRPDGLTLSVRLTPRASRDGIDGVDQGTAGTHLKARVRAVPEDGRANAALVELVAAELHVPKSTVTVAAGQTARLKTLHIAGDGASLQRKLEDLLKRFE